MSGVLAWRWMNEWLVFEQIRWYGTLGERHIVPFFGVDRLGWIMFDWLVGKMCTAWHESCCKTCAVLCMSLVTCAHCWQVTYCFFTVCFADILIWCLLYQSTDGLTLLEKVEKGYRVVTEHGVVTAYPYFNMSAYRGEWIPTSLLRGSTWEWSPCTIGSVFVLLFIASRITDSTPYSIEVYGYAFSSLPRN